MSVCVFVWHSSACSMECLFDVANDRETARVVWNF